MILDDFKKCQEKVKLAQEKQAQVKAQLSIVEQQLKKYGLKKMEELDPFLETVKKEETKKMKEYMKTKEEFDAAWESYLEDE